MMTLNQRVELKTFPAAPAVRRITVARYHHLGEIGFFSPDERVELIEGMVYMMSPKKPRHAEGVQRLVNLWPVILQGRAWVRSRDPITIAEADSEPEPDVALVTARAQGYVNRHPIPSDVLLVVEVADTSPEYDRDIKGPLYAAAGIPEYWIVNLVENVIEVYRGPQAGAYQGRRVARPDERLAPQALPECELLVSQVLP